MVSLFNAIISFTSTFNLYGSFKILFIVIIDDIVPDGVNTVSQYGSHPSYLIIFTSALKFILVISNPGISFA